MTDFQLFMRENDVNEEQLEAAKSKLTPTHPVPSYLYIGASSIEGEGVFTTMHFPRGRFLDNLWKNGWTQTGLKLNHSATPNCEIDKMRLLVAKNVVPDEELTVNYRKVLQ